MAKLATKFTEAGIVDVNTDRLTARIPIVKFNFPYSRNGETILVECDLSLQNPLACLNTSLLHAYSKIFPSTCTLASIIKRWAKARDINEPSKHTLSSYGYVLMLLYYLTSSESTGDGGVITPEGGNNSNPILPNLQVSYIEFGVVCKWVFVFQQQSFLICMIFSHFLNTLSIKCGCVPTSKYTCSTSGWILLGLKTLWVLTAKFLPNPRINFVDPIQQNPIIWLILTSTDLGSRV